MARKISDKIRQQWREFAAAYLDRFPTVPEGAAFPVSQATHRCASDFGMFLVSVPSGLSCLSLMGRLADTSKLPPGYTEAVGWPAAISGKHNLYVDTDPGRWRAALDYHFSKIGARLPNEQDLAEWAVEDAAYAVKWAAYKKHCDDYVASHG
jgi:capsid protein